MTFFYHVLGRAMKTTVFALHCLVLRLGGCDKQYALAEGYWNVC